MLWARCAEGTAAWRRAKSSPASSCQACTCPAVLALWDRSNPPASAKTLTFGSLPSSRRSGTGTTALRKASRPRTCASSVAWMRTTIPPLRATRRRRGLWRSTCHVRGSTMPEAWARPMWTIRSGSETMSPHWSHRPSSSVREEVGRFRRWALAALFSPFATASGHSRRAQPTGRPSASASEALMDTPGLMRTRVATREASTASDRRKESRKRDSASDRFTLIARHPLGCSRRRSSHWPPTRGRPRTPRGAGRACRPEGRARLRSTRRGSSAGRRAGRG